MKIIILANNSGGLANFREKLLIKLREKAELIAITPIDIRLNILNQLGVKVINVDMDRRGMNPIKDLKLAAKYNSILRTEKPDLVITYTIKPNIYGGMVCRYNKIKYASNITGLGTAFEKNWLLRIMIICLYRIGLKKAETVFFENGENKNTFIKNRIIDENKAYVLNGAGVDLKKFYYSDYPPNRNVFIFLFIGRVMKEKGINELIESMKRLIDEGEKVELHVLGRCEEDYQEIMEKYSKEGWLKYYGIQEDVRPFIAKAHCFILPSWHEGMANTNLECAASGRPVITTNIPGCKEAVIDKVTGFLCEYRNTDDLCKSMRNMIRLDNETRRKMGISGRKHMQEIFDKEKVVNETIKVLKM